MKVTVNLTQHELKSAIAEYLNKNGFSTSIENVGFSVIKGDRPGEPDCITAIVTCNSVVKLNKPVYRGE